MEGGKWKGESGKWKGNRGLQIALSFTMVSKHQIKTFEDLIVWQKSMQLARDVYRATREGCLAGDWGLRNQIQRAAVSIPSNIAKGFERNSAQELRHFLSIAKGSAGELRTQLTLASNIGYLKTDEARILLDLCIEISRMLEAYKKGVKRKK